MTVDLRHMTMGGRIGYWLHVVAALLMVVGGLTPWPSAGAQDSTRVTQLADRGPRFLSPPTATSPGVDLSDAPVLKRRVTLELNRVPLGTALQQITKQAGIRFAFATGAVPVDKSVSLSASDLTVGAALYDLLVDMYLDVHVSRPDLLTLVPRNGTPGGMGRQQGGGTIAGRVVDAITHVPLDQVAVHVEGPGVGAATTSAGRYTVRNIPPGTYRVAARRVGYTPLTKTITVSADSTAVVDFALAAAPTKLDEVVTTAVGEQRRYEVGNVISTINADSIVPTAPITSLTDLISARAPGVTIEETGGLTGSGEAIRIRGNSSLVLQGDPIVIVDGMRQDNSAGGDLSATFNGARGIGSHPTPSRLNDINFADVESIDVLKGPSASTEYGTDAANGVIVITTKHGTAGQPQWKASAERTRSDIPVSFPNGYYSWGHLTDGTRTAVNCPLVPIFGAPASTAGTCAVDSVTRWNPLNHAATSIFGSGSRQKYDMSVGGGPESVRYFVAGSLTNEHGIIQFPPAFRQLADTAGIHIPNSAFNANTEQQRSIRANTTIRLGSQTDLTATGSYVSTYQTTPQAASLYQGALFGPALRDQAHYYGYYYFNQPNYTPLATLANFGSQDTRRLIGGLTGSWRPSAWFVGHTILGLDHGSQRDNTLNYPLSNSVYQGGPPVIALGDGATDVYSVDLRGTATAAVTPSVRSATSIGVQMVDTRVIGQSAYARGITATNLTLNGATNATVTQQSNRQATLGGYGDEQIGIGDRLFLNGALRIDAGSGFGRAYSTAVYPKASISWLAVSDARTTLRVRGAFGESGVQPTNGAAATLYAANVGYVGGTTVTTFPLAWPGNPHLRPERSRELEGGIDIGAWGNRLSIELAAYSKATRDALVNVNLGGSVCCYIYQENIGKVRNTGLEGAITARLVQARWLAWDVAVNASLNQNRLVSLAPGVLSQIVSVYPGQERQAAGYPLYGVWAPRVAFADDNHDGIIELNEATLADSASYVAPSLPTREVSVSTHLGLWRGAVTVGGLVDYRGGYRIANLAAVYADFNGRQREDNVPSAPLWLQARAVENVAHGGFNALDAEDGSFVRIRELAVTYAVSRSVARALRQRSLSITGAVRNLKLWTRYTGVDPEATNTQQANSQFAPTSGGYVVNNDVRADLGAVPLARYWVVRLNLGL